MSTSTLMQASQQWSSRPADERYLSIPDMVEHFADRRRRSKAVVVASPVIDLVPADDNRGLYIAGRAGVNYTPSHWAFGQIAQLAESPAGYLRTLPSPIVADCLNYKLKHVRDTQDVGLLLYANGTRELLAATGPNYGRVWNEDVCRALLDRFGDGVSGDWRVPGEFGQRVNVTKDNTTLYASDRDMFVFLADEDHRFTVPNRRNGQSGEMARGFFVWNSEVGKCTLGIATFLFDYVCCNRIVWGAESYQEIRIRHTASAPVWWLDEVVPVLDAYSRASARPIEDAVKAAQAKRLDKVDEFLASRFGKRLVGPVKAVHELEEGRPVETVWDAVTAATAYARGIKHTDERVEMERQAGSLLSTVL